MASISAHITFGILKLMGIKDSFSQDPIDVKKVRKSDCKSPSKRFQKRWNTRMETIAESQITELQQTGVQKGKHIVYIHGGAFVSGPAQHHWDGLHTFCKGSPCSAWLVDYPKAPEADIRQISANIDAVYEQAVARFGADQLILMGDSAGATLIMSLIQRRIASGDPLPSKLVLITPVFDARINHPDIPKLDPKDPMLSQKGVLSAKKLCAGPLALTDPMLSPGLASFEGFPETVLFVGGRDILYADSLLAIAQMRKAKVPLKLVNDLGMPHIWPLLPVLKEGKQARKQLLAVLREES